MKLLCEIENYTRKIANNQNIVWCTILVTKISYTIARVMLKIGHHHLTKGTNCPSKCPNLSHLGTRSGLTHLQKTPKAVPVDRPHHNIHTKSHLASRSDLSVEQTPRNFSITGQTLIYFEFDKFSFGAEAFRSISLCVYLKIPYCYDAERVCAAAQRVSGTTPIDKLAKLRNIECCQLLKLPGGSWPRGPPRWCPELGAPVACFDVKIIFFFLEFRLLLNFNSEKSIKLTGTGNLTY